MIDKKRIDYLINTIQGLTQFGASPGLDEYWNEIVNSLSQDINETEKYFNECNENQIVTIAGYFEDISYNLQDKKFINILEKIQEKFSGIDLGKDIQWAKDAIEE